MCTFYTLRLSAWEVRNLMQHYKLIGREWEEVIGKHNDTMENAYRVCRRCVAALRFLRGRVR